MFWRIIKISKSIHKSDILFSKKDYSKEPQKITFFKTKNKTRNIENTNLTSFRIYNCSCYVQHLRQLRLGCQEMMHDVGGDMILFPEESWDLKWLLVLVLRLLCTATATRWDSCSEKVRVGKEHKRTIVNISFLI